MYVFFAFHQEIVNIFFEQNHYCPPNYALSQFLFCCRDKNMRQRPKNAHVFSIYTQPLRGCYIYSKIRHIHLQNHQLTTYYNDRQMARPRRGQTNIECCSIFNSTSERSHKKKIAHIVSQGCRNKFSMTMHEALSSMGQHQFQRQPATIPESISPLPPFP